ncbi:hypothetical protein GTY85_09980 [Streptomyces sp. SID8377]|nr:hypothetical protein [Streptomyces sp. SID8377]
MGPLYASSGKVALALLMGLARTAPGEPNEAAVRLVEHLGLTPSFEAARMYTGPVPDVDLAGMYGVTSLELGWLGPASRARRRSGRLPGQGGRPERRWAGGYWLMV